MRTSLQMRVALMAAMVMAPAAMTSANPTVVSSKIRAPEIPYPLRREKHVAQWKNEQRFKKTKGKR